MTPSPEAEGGESCSLALKILYTLHGIDSLKYIVKPEKKIDLRVFRGIDLAILEIIPCLEAIRKASPEFSGICETHGNDYAVYSVDFSEEDTPLQCHGKVSQESMIEATGKLCASKIRGEHVEVHIHILPIRKPSEMLAKAEEELNQQIQDALHSDVMNSEMLDMASSQSGGLPSSSQNSTGISTPNSSGDSTGAHRDHPLADSAQKQQHMQQQNERMQHLFPFLPVLPPPVQIPPSLLRHEPTLPSSPPVRARPTKIAPTSLGKRHSSEVQPAKKRKSTTSPKPKDEVASQCRNCGVETASTWRRVELPEGNKELLCNACALYYKSKRVMRPSELWDRRTRTEADKSFSGSGMPTVDPRMSIPLSSMPPGMHHSISQGMHPSMHPSVHQGMNMHHSVPQNMQNMPHNMHQSMHQSMHQGMRQNINPHVSFGLPPHALQLSQQQQAQQQVQQQQKEQPLEQQQQAHQVQQKQQAVPQSTIPATPHDSIELWSNENNAQQNLRSDDNDISDRLVDNPLKLNNAVDAQLPPASTPVAHSIASDKEKAQSASSHVPPAEPPVRTDTEIDENMKVTLDPPSTPRGKQSTSAPDSIQKLLNFSTPERKSTVFLPGSGSTGKWLRKVMNNAEFEDLLRSPSNRDGDSSLPDLAVFTSSPPTSSTLFSEVSDWSLPPPDSPLKATNLEFDEGVQIK